MEIKDNKIKASDGMMLTNGNTYAKMVALGVADSPDSWHEITEAEYKEICESEENSEQ